MTVSNRTYNDAYDIQASAGTVSVGEGTKTSINVGESRGTADGIAAIGSDSTVEVLGETSISATGKTNAYTLYTDAFSTKLDQGGDLFRTDGDLQHVWQFPVGVNLSKSFETESGWKVKPQLDLSVVPAVGDIKTKIDVRTPGVNASDSMTRRVMDTTSFDGVFGVELQKDNVSFSLGYNVQASEHQTGQGVTASFIYKF